MRSVGPALVIWCLAAFAAPGIGAAAPRACEGHANGDRGDRVVVLYEVDDGRISRARAIWSPPRKGDDAFPMLHVEYDLRSGFIGPPVSLRVAGYVEMDPTPASRTATVVLKLDEGRRWSRPWETFASRMATLEQPGGGLDPTKTGKALGFFNGIAMAYRRPDGESLNIDLLDGLAKARRADVLFAGDVGETFGQRSFDLSAIEQRDSLMREAWLYAAESAGAPAGCTPVPD